MRHEVRERLEHVIDAGEAVIGWCTGKTFHEYASDRMLRSAVEREFTVIGEALREAVRIEPDIRTSIPEYRRIVDFRNILVHDYAAIYDEGVWRIIENELPLLLREVRALLGPPPA